MQGNHASARNRRHTQLTYATTVGWVFFFFLSAKGSLYTPSPLSQGPTFEKKIQVIRDHEKKTITADVAYGTTNGNIAKHRDFYTRINSTC